MPQKAQHKVSKFKARLRPNTAVNLWETDSSGVSGGISNRGLAKIKKYFYTYIPTLGWNNTPQIISGAEFLSADWGTIFSPARNSTGFIVSGVNGALAYSQPADPPAGTAAIAGVTWTQISSPFSGSPNINSVHYGNIWMVASADGRISTSENGINWNSPVSVSSYAINCLKYNDGIWVAGGINGLKYSLNKGVTWQNVLDATIQSSTIKDIEYAYGNWYIVGNGIGYDIAYSNDLINWNYTNVPNFRIDHDADTIVFTENFLIMGSRKDIAPEINLGFSTDGLSWDSFKPQAINGVSSVEGPADIVVNDGNIVYSPNKSYASTQVWNAITNSMQVFQNGSNFFSSGGVNGKVAVGGFRFLATSAQATAKYADFDSRYTKYANKNISLPNTVYSVNGQIYSFYVNGIVFISDVYTNGRIWYSKNNEFNQWFSIDTGLSSAVLDIIYINNKYVANTIGNKVATSSNLIDWSITTFQYNLGGEISSDGQKIIIPTYSSSNARIYTSANGQDWTTITPNVGARYITYKNGIYVGGQALSGTNVYTSTDLTTWTATFTRAGNYQWYTYWSDAMQGFIARRKGDLLVNNHMTFSRDGYTWSPGFHGHVNGLDEIQFDDKSMFGIYDLSNGSAGIYKMSFDSAAQTVFPGSINNGNIGSFLIFDNKLLVTYRTTKTAKLFYSTV